MGSSFAPSVVSLFMVQLENVFILNKEFNPYFEHINIFIDLLMIASVFTTMAT